MRAYALDELGTPGAVRDLPDPEPSEGQVLVRVAAAGVNPFDHAVVQGHLRDAMDHRFPFVPGSDASGTVEAVGDGVTEWSVGDEVFGTSGKSYVGGGSFAERTVLAVGSVARRPEDLAHDAAAAMPVPGGTALTMLDTAAVAEGDVVLVLGATGGVGSYLVPIAAARGARVIAVASGRNADYAKRLGAAEVVDYTAGDVVEAVRSRAPDGVAAVADLHGDRDVLARLAEHVREGGYVVSAVGSADIDALAERKIEGTNVQGQVTTASLTTLASMHERGELVPPEIESFPLEQAWDALTDAGSGHTRGKLVVLPT
jgi:NADPH:quinone reductase